jgi:acetyl esterase/lipase
VGGDGASRPARRLLTAGALAGGALGIRWVSRRLARARPARAAVAPDLRHPVLLVDFSLATDRDLARARRVMELVRRVLVRRGPQVPGVEIRDRFVPVGPGDGPGPRVRLIRGRAAHRRSGALLWIHGGGMVMGNPEQDDLWLSGLADELGILVVSVDYRLAPEHPYPAALDDCMAALRWLCDAADELGVDPGRVAVGGASAGGGLAAAVALRARDEGGPPVCFQLLDYPMLDDRTVLRTDHAGTGAFVWTPVSNRFGWSAYLGAPPRERDDRVHAAPARATDLSGLPPAWVGVGQLDLFHAEDVDYARRLAEAGVACELVDEPGMYHGADQLVPNAPRMQAYRRSMVDALRHALS